MSTAGSMLYLPQEPKTIRASYSFLNENNFTLLKPERPELLRGPRRVIRLCMFAVLLPAVLITIPLYVRLVIYPPAHYTMMPTDQRLLARHVSTFWCQSQRTHMNGSFNLYVCPGKPATSSSHTIHHMLHSLTLQDDVKEYWGFHLLKGSRITISSCSSTDGAQLMILRGVNNLRRCAWIGEEDSAEELEDVDVEDPVRESDAHHKKDQQDRLLDSVKTSAQQGPAEDENLKALGPMMTDETYDLLYQNGSEERRQDLRQLLREAKKISKNNKEILQILHSVGRGAKRPIPERIGQIMGFESKERKIGSTTDISSSQRGTDEKPNKRKKIEKFIRETRSVDDWDTVHNDGAFEMFDDLDEDSVSGKSSNPTERIIGGHIFFPEGLKLERGKFNQTNRRDGSNEEDASSYSSSEEALARCEGVIMTLPLVSYRSCSYRWTDTNKIVYDIPITGTYYFVFSSDNEITTNKLYFNLTMERVVYETHEAQEVCSNTNECSVPLSFLSRQETVVEVPQEQTWDHSYILDTTCQPRVPVYLVFLLLAPLLILFCAFQ
ncbi:uncharacterized protein [Panulirus ornatus]|uniref:uncharacterized protein isoform X2 n=1 Tax=Panulirus ornatus TaxID=150431 RepID=UPI003A855DB4